jgi:hypothetical protein
MTAQEWKQVIDALTTWILPLLGWMALAWYRKYTKSRSEIDLALALPQIAFEVMLRARANNPKATFQALLPDMIDEMQELIKKWDSPAVNKSAGIKAEVLQRILEAQWERLTVPSK